MKQWFYVTTKARLCVFARARTRLCVFTFWPYAVKWRIQNHAECISNVFTVAVIVVCISVSCSTMIFGFQIDIFMLMMLIDQIFGTLSTSILLIFPFYTPSPKSLMYSMMTCYTFITAILAQSWSVWIFFFQFALSANLKRFIRYLYGHVKCNNCFHSYTLESSALHSIHWNTLQ